MMNGLLLLMVLHATWMIDLRKLAAGPVFFRGHKATVQVILVKSIARPGMCPERRVKISDEHGRREFTLMDPHDGNISANSNSSRLGSDEDYGRNYKYTRRRLRRRCR
nr:unnamed protein product [Callosobruchus chinensis]